MEEKNQIWKKKNLHINSQNRNNTRKGNETKQKISRLAEIPPGVICEVRGVV